MSLLSLILLGLGIVLTGTIAGRHSYWLSKRLAPGQARWAGYIGFVGGLVGGVLFPLAFVTAGMFGAAGGAAVMNLVGMRAFAGGVLVVAAGVVAAGVASYVVAVLAVLLAIGTIICAAKHLPFRALGGSAL